MLRDKLTCRWVARTGSSASFNACAAAGPPPPANWPKIEGLQVTSERFDQVPGHTLADFLALMAAEERAIKNVQSHATK